MILGSITADGLPIIELILAGRSWTAIMDTGFNGDLELPDPLRSEAHPRFLCRNRSMLAAGQIIEEDTFLVDFPFDGRLCLAEATFSGHDQILIGTHLLREYRLEIDFPGRLLRLTRIP